MEQGVKESFEAPNGSSFSTTNALTKSALRLLIARWPLGLPFRELFAASRAELGLPAQGEPSEMEAQQKLLGEELLSIYAAGFLDLRVWTPRVVTEISERPLASPYARLQATTSDRVTNLLHQRVTIDEFSRALVPLLDGSRDVDGLSAALAGAATAPATFAPGPSSQGRPSPEQTREKVRQTLGSPGEGGVADRLGPVDARGLATVASSTHSLQNIMTGTSGSLAR
jgi:hypothetical protein